MINKIKQWWLKIRLGEETLSEEETLSIEEIVAGGIWISEWKLLRLLRGRRVLTVKELRLLNIPEYDKLDIVRKTHLNDRFLDILSTKIAIDLLFLHQWESGHPFSAIADILPKDISIYKLISSVLKQMEKKPKAG